MEGLESKNYYELLGVPLEATTEQIKEAYKEIARVYHPDSNFYSEIVEAKLTDEDMKVFKLVTAAYNTLAHAEKRAEYDKLIPKNLRGWEEPGERSTHEAPQAKNPSKPTRFGQVYESPFQDAAPDDGPKSVRDIIRDRQQRVRKRKLMIISVITVSALLIISTLLLVLFVK